MVKLKRVYEHPEKSDGFRILVDRLWPRGLSKDKAKIDLWMRDVAPSSSLRKWFAHDPDKWEEFRKRYRTELRSKKELLNRIRRAEKQKTVTLLYSARDENHNNAVVLKEVLKL